MSQQPQAVLTIDRPYPGVVALSWMNARSELEVDLREHERKLLIDGRPFVASRELTAGCKVSVEATRKADSEEWKPPTPEGDAILRGED